MSERVFITGHDGSCLSEFLDTQGYEIFAIVRRSSVEICDHLSHLLEEHP